MKTSAGRRVRRIAVFGASGLAAVVLLTSLSFACTVPIGGTFFTDGKIAKTVARGTRISVYATGASQVGSSRVDLQACKLEYSIVSPK